MLEAIKETISYISERTGIKPDVGIILGTGLGGMVGEIDVEMTLEYENIPNFPVSTVESHHGKLIFGHLNGKKIMAMQGRFHFYEGYSPGQLVVPVRVMNALGIETLIVTNAAGGLNPSYQEGDLMLIRDHLNFPGMAGNNPLRGPNDDTVGERFPDMTKPYDEELRALARHVAQVSGFDVQEGVYAYVAGPSFETPAELRFLQIAGGDAVGMSTAPSVVAARHAGMRVLGISTITNMALPDPPPGTAHSHEEVLAAGQQAVPRLIQVVRGVLRDLPSREV